LPDPEQVRSAADWRQRRGSRRGKERFEPDRKYSYLACREEMEAALEAAGLSVRKYQRKKPAKALVKVGLQGFVEGA